MMKRVFINKKVVSRNFSRALNVGFGAISVLFLFFSPKDDFDIVLDSFWKKCLPIFMTFVAAGVWAVISACFYRKNVIVDETQKSIILRYGNLWRYAFPRFSKKERIVVVQVNTAFDVIVDSPGVLHPLVGSSTIHGQWIEQMKKRGVSADDLTKIIKRSLEEQRIEPSCVVHKDRGNEINYPRGTIAQYKYKNTTFYLLAISEFDEKNNAQNTQEKLSKTILKLIEFIGQYSQGADVYMPIMGSGTSRTGIDDQTALEILATSLKLNRNNLNGNINVVVYEGIRDKVSIEGGY